MLKLKSLSAGLLVSLLIASAPILSVQSVRSDEVQPSVVETVSLNSNLQARNGGETVAGLFRLVWRFLSRGL